MIITVPNKIYIGSSNLHGLGVFAKEKIFKDELIEECPIHKLHIIKGNSDPCLNDYRFNWPKTDNWTHQVVTWGYGSLYNHSNNPNAEWRDSDNLETFKFYAIRDIEINEEILVYYGGDEYWNDSRLHVNVK